ncbi:MAG: arginine decarboxylase, partial [Ruminococcus sp.]|nr:arginine decarboxylase [Ruminococcus sp.]
MATPINDFVKAYSKSGTVRFHMPGHKGTGFHGLEPLDITEINGADYLYDADGIIGQSEAQTAKAFGTAATFFCTEGSSLCIKTMLGLVKLSSKAQRPVILAPRNVHKAFIDAKGP